MIDNVPEAFCIVGQILLLEVWHHFYSNTVLQCFILALLWSALCSTYYDYQ